MTTFKTGEGKVQVEDNGKLVVEIEIDDIADDGDVEIWLKNALNQAVDAYMEVVNDEMDELRAVVLIEEEKRLAREEIH